jgi:hypothetical protein
MALTLGLDAIVPLGSRVALVPFARGSRVLGQQDTNDTRYSHGLSSAIIRVGASVRIRLGSDR